MKKLSVLTVLILTAMIFASCSQEDTDGSVSSEPLPEVEMPQEQPESENQTGLILPEKISTEPDTYADTYYDGLLEEYREDAVKYDAIRYARLFGISMEEGLYRMDIQQKAGPFGAELERNEGATLTGFWMEHEPEFRLVASFTSNGEATLEKYREKYPELVAITDVVNMDYTLEQLQEIQLSTSETLGKAGFSVSSGINVQTNRVEIYITDNDYFLKVLEDNGIELSPAVEPIIIYEPLDGTPPGLIPEASVHMAQLKLHPGSGMDALLQGKLEVKDGYLYIDDHLIIWLPDYFIHNNEGKIEIWNKNGTVVGRVGEGINMGGGELGTISSFSDSLTEPLPEGLEGKPWVQNGDPEMCQTREEIMAGLSPQEILEEVTMYCEYPGEYLEAAGIEPIEPVHSMEYSDPSEAQYITASTEYTLPASRTLMSESWLEGYTGFRKESMRDWNNDGIQGKSSTFFLVSKPSVTLDINMYYTEDGSAIWELVVTEEVLLSQPYDATLIPDDISSISLTYSETDCQEITDIYPIMELTEKVNSLPERPNYVILGGLPGPPIYTLVFHSASQGDITVSCLAGEPDSGINIDGYPVLHDTKNLLLAKVIELSKDN